MKWINHSPGKPGIKSLISGFSGLLMKLKTMATSPYDLSCWWDVKHKQTTTSFGYCRTVFWVTMRIKLLALGITQCLLWGSNRGTACSHIEHFINDRDTVLSNKVWYFRWTICLIIRQVIHDSSSLIFFSNISIWIQFAPIWKFCLHMFFHWRI